MLTEGLILATWVEHLILTMTRIILLVLYAETEHQYLVPIKSGVTLWQLEQHGGFPMNHLWRM